MAWQNLAMRTVITTILILFFMLAGRVQAGVLNSDIHYGEHSLAVGFTSDSSVSDSDPVRDVKLRSTYRHKGSVEGSEARVDLIRVAARRPFGSAGICGMDRN